MPETQKPRKRGFCVARVKLGYNYIMIKKTIFYACMLFSLTLAIGAISNAFPRTASAQSLQVSIVGQPQSVLSGSSITVTWPAVSTPTRKTYNVYVYTTDCSSTASAPQVCKTFPVPQKTFVTSVSSSAGRVSFRATAGDTISRYGQIMLEDAAGKNGLPSGQTALFSWSRSARSGTGGTVSTGTGSSGTGVSTGSSGSTGSTGGTCSAICTMDYVTLCKDGKTWSGPSSCTCNVTDANDLKAQGWGSCSSTSGGSNTGSSETVKATTTPSTGSARVGSVGSSGIPTSNTSSSNSSSATRVANLLRPPATNTPNYLYVTSGTPAATGAACRQLSKTFGYGSRDIGTNGEVTILQNFLHRNGYLGVPATGYFGTQTRAAFVRFQTRHNILPTGSVDLLSRGTLNGQICR